MQRKNETKKERHQEKPYESTGEDRPFNWIKFQFENAFWLSAPQHVTALMLPADLFVKCSVHSLFLSHRNAIATMRDSFHVCVPNWACTIYTNAHRMIHTRNALTLKTAVPKAMGSLRRRFSPWHLKKPKIAFHLCHRFVFSKFGV